jgi:choline dehydrogenase-like flavoprotein
MNSDRFDVIIIGTGAGGGTLAARLAPTGLKILLLERGEFLPREKENWDPDAVAKGRYQAKETWYDEHDQPFQPYTHYWVGGNTKVYGAALLRLRERDFGEVRHHGGLSPAWPIPYDELEPYYTLAENLYSVHGQRGADPCEPWSTAPYPHPPLPHEPRIGQLYADLHTLGYRPFPVALGVRLPADAGRGATRAPYVLGNFDGYPDPTEVKADAHVVGVEAALASPNVTLVTGARVDRLIGSGGAVKEVVATVAEREERFRGDVVALACGAINSAALLLRSGLANSSGLVGRNYMCHHNGLFIAVTSEPNDAVFQKTFGMTDFYAGDPREPRSLPLGTVQLMGKPDHATLAFMAEGALPGVAPADIAARSIDFFLTAEDLPDPSNRVELRPDGAIRLVRRPTNAEAYRRLEGRLKGVLDEVDRRRGRAPATYLTLPLGTSGVSHQCGTLRFGTDPAASVLDVHCKAHDLDNLYVVDGSFFPSSGAVNPSLTIMANALRVGDHLVSRLGARAARHTARPHAFA